MEPAQVEVVFVYHSRVEQITTNPEYTGRGFRFGGIGSLFWMESDLQPGDRVRITITKEPTDAKLG